MSWQWRFVLPSTKKVLGSFEGSEENAQSFSTAKIRWFVSPCFFSREHPKNAGILLEENSTGSQKELKLN